jgi:hypothetical protein
MGRVIRRRRVPRRDDQRIWQGRRVDKDLKDEWLDELNSLLCMDLVSICQGHPDQDRRFRRTPHITLRFKPLFATRVHAKQQVEWLRNIVLTHVQCPKTAVEIESRIVARGVGDSRQTVVVRLFFSIENDGPTDKWFEKMVRSMDAADADILAIYHMAVRPFAHMI